MKTFRLHRRCQIHLRKLRISQRSISPVSENVGFRSSERVIVCYLHLPRYCISQHYIRSTTRTYPNLSKWRWVDVFTKTHCVIRCKQQCQPEGFKLPSAQTLTQTLDVQTDRVRLNALFKDANSIIEYTRTGQTWLSRFDSLILAQHKWTAAWKRQARMIEHYLHFLETTCHQQYNVGKTLLKPCRGLL